MRRSMLLFIIFSFVTISASFAQGFSDFYFPLRVGNNWAYRTPDVNNGWASRTTLESIEGTDLIAGQLYYRVRGVEIPDSNPADSMIFHVFWLRQDPGGNIFIGALSDVSTNLDSAMRFEPPSPFFTNDFLTAGYARTYPGSWRGVTVMDSVEGVNETVVASAGSFSNCLKICNQQKDSLGQVVFQEHAYYARGVGEVRRTREIPLTEAHVNDLVDYSAVTSIANGQTVLSPSAFILQQNFPNPFNPQTTIRYTLPRSSFVTLSVYSVLGQQLADLVKADIDAGSHSVQFNAGNLASGVYFYRLQAGSFVETKKLVVTR